LTSERDAPTLSQVSMPKISAGILLYRRRDSGVEVLLVHPGGPLWAKKDDGAWSIPKGEVDDAEDLLAAARRELREETGLEPEGPFVALGSVRQRSGKTVHAFAAEGDCVPSALSSNTFELEWPPRSGRRATFPEVDRAEYFDPETAQRKLNAAQGPFVQRLVDALSGR
jgi:predicted NUDIX family NTP pyrophosphohydrolase